MPTVCLPEQTGSHRSVCRCVFTGGCLHLEALGCPLLCHQCRPLMATKTDLWVQAASNPQPGPVAGFFAVQCTPVPALPACLPPAWYWPKLACLQRSVSMHTSAYLQPCNTGASIAPTSCTQRPAPVLGRPSAAGLSHTLFVRSVEHNTLHAAFILSGARILCHVSDCLSSCVRGDTPTSTHLCPLISLCEARVGQSINRELCSTRLPWHCPMVGLFWAMSWWSH